jgi:hypothetical protein
VTAQLALAQFEGPTTTLPMRKRGRATRSGRRAAPGCSGLLRAAPGTTIAAPAGRVQFARSLSIKCIVGIGILRPS